MHNRSLPARYLDLREERPNADLVTLLADLGQEFGLNNLSYLGLKKGDQGEVDARIFSTYDAAWVDRYQSQNYHLIDPVINDALSGVLPIDWRRIPRNDRVTRHFFGEASEFGVCNNGLSIPLRGPANERAVLTVNADMKLSDWNKYTQQFTADLTYLGYLLHNDAIANDNRPAKVIELSRREKEVLKWAAIGKTAWETAQIISLTERTVNHHLYNACAKLNVSNKTHAVVKAIEGGHINV
jgi:DNA-binding CsgD family transcriptional regulator